MEDIHMTVDNFAGIDGQGTFYRQYLLLKGCFVYVMDMEDKTL